MESIRVSSSARSGFQGGGGGGKGCFTALTGSSRARGIRKYLGGESSFPVAEWLNRGVVDDPQLGDFFSASVTIWGEN
eukprot:5414543-Pyramimonas_sp.AAC.2